MDGLFGKNDGPRNFVAAVLGGPHFNADIWDVARSARSLPLGQELTVKPVSIVTRWFVEPFAAGPLEKWHAILSQALLSCLPTVFHGFCEYRSLGT